MSNVTSLASLFASTKSLSNVDALSNWDTSSIWRMSQMFYGASNVKDASMLHWNTKSVTNYSIIFYYSGVPSSKYPTFYVKLEDRNNLSDTTKNVVIDEKWSPGWIHTW